MGKQGDRRSGKGTAEKSAAESGSITRTFLSPRDYLTLIQNFALCPDGWEGYHCEFKSGQVPECDLNFQNGGVCLVGIRTPGEAAQMHHVWTQEEAHSHMWCHCPPQFAGRTCLNDLENCGDDV